MGSSKRLASAVPYTSGSCLEDCVNSRTKLNLADESPEHYWGRASLPRRDDKHVSIGQRRLHIRLKHSLTKRSHTKRPHLVDLLPKTLVDLKKRPVCVKHASSVDSNVSAVLGAMLHPEDPSPAARPFGMQCSCMQSWFCDAASPCQGNWSGKYVIVNACVSMLYPNLLSQQVRCCMQTNCIELCCLR